MADANLIRRRFVVRGVVQGVGFRPFVFRTAVDCGVTGTVCNTTTGVVIEAQGEGSRLDRFHQLLCNDPPLLAAIESVTYTDVSAISESGFRIILSQDGQALATSIPPDLAACADCLRELQERSDRRYGYPFLNCTNCGPRFTIIQSLPYDRPGTTMRDFAMCPDCAREYDDPLNRRFHAQPTACPRCGPHVWWECGEARLTGCDALAAARNALRDGRIVALKGLGGFHLGCDAANDDALAALRSRKGRVEKPFALMVRDLSMARALCQVDDGEEALLDSREKPIVLLRRREPPALPLSQLVAPGNRYLGLMLPYTPLHTLLMEDRPLVMTSGNLSDEPIARTNEEASRRLAALADGFLFHNREIHMVCDDSVIRAFRNAELPLRRSRGYAPMPVLLPFDPPSTLAVGGELKATFCVTRGRHAYMSQHIGDMENLETVEAFDRAVDHYLTLFRIQPQRVVADLHPGYLSRQWAERFATSRGLPLVTVQHHHAHLAAVIAENGLPSDQNVIAFCFDGTGYGLDGAIWGGEVLTGGYDSFRRYAHLKYIPLPGGDAAIRRPYRTALAHLWAAGVPWPDPLPCTAEEARVLRRQLQRSINTVPTSSMGRLFDAAASLLGVRQSVTYEGQAALEMEALAHNRGIPFPRFRVVNSEIDPAPILDRLAQPGDVPGLAYAFHEAVADLISDVAIRARHELGLTTAALSGGVFQNVLLLQLTVDRLEAAGFRVLTHHLVPPNDGGLSLGQAVCSGTLVLAASVK
jgi:hydrogenase maturation protein HypF